MINLISEFKGLNKQEKIIFISVLLAMIEPYSLLVFLAGTLLWEIKNKRYFSEVLKNPGAKIMCVFLAVWLAISVFYFNGMGILIMGGYVLIFGYVVYYRKYLTKRLLPLIVEGIVLSSIFVNICGLGQFWYISNKYGRSLLEFHVFNSPNKRITFTYWNANFYAMVIEFAIVCCMTRFVQCKKIGHKLFYVGVGFFNLFLMYLTGCRAAFLPFLFVVPVFLFMTKEYKWFAASLVCIALFLLAFYFYPNIIPRMDDLKTLESRYKIWSCAIKGFRDHPLLGQGPESYILIRTRYNGHVAPHTHNIYLESLVNYGIVGTGMIVAYIVPMVKDAWNMRKWKEHPEYFAISIALTIIVLVHGTLDCTLNMPSAGLLYLIFVNMGCLKEVVFKIE